jgi:hypothetical protein
MSIDRTIAGFAMAVALAVPLSAHAAKANLTATLDGNSEPTGGDPDGGGKFLVELDPDSGEVCYRFTITNIARPTLLEILRGPIGANGPVTIILEAGSDVCVDSDPKIVAAIIASPGDYYVNFFNRDFPSGALRGQLVANQFIAK